MIRITEMQTKILEALNRYKFLTCTQLKGLKIGNLQYIRGTMKHLAEYPTTRKAVVGVIRFPPEFVIGRVEHVYYLSEYGAYVLADILSIDFEELDYQRVTSVYDRDYWHRRSCVDFHIWLTHVFDVSTKLELLKVDRYFDKTGANNIAPSKQKPRGPLRSQTRVDFEDRYIIPDINFVIQAADAPKARGVYCFEMCNGQNTRRVLTQIRKHMEAMKAGVICKVYDAPQKAHTCLFLFSEDGLMKAVRDRFTELSEIPALVKILNPEDYESNFLFAMIDEAQADVVRCWRKAAHLGEDRYVFLNGKKVPSP